MKLLFKQRLFSWLDSYDIYYEDGSVAYTVKGQLAWGHCLKIFDPEGYEIGTVKEKVLTWMPRFEVYLGEQYIGSISKEFTWFKPKYNIDFNGWQIQGRMDRVGLYYSRAHGRRAGGDKQGDMELDGHVYHRRHEPGRRALRADVRAGY